MKTKKDVIKIIEQFLDGKYDTLQFTYDLPWLLTELSDEEWENFPRKVMDELPTICANYDPPLRNDGYLDDKELKKQIQKYYKMIK